MKQHTITDQPAILRLLLEQGVDGQIKPLDPERPGACGMFPDISIHGTWYIVDLFNGFHTATILEDCTTEEAVACLREYVHRFLREPMDFRVNVCKMPEPAMN